jgi:hypothetical protein
MYRIIDMQGMGTHENEVYETTEEIREHLASYHSIDWEGEGDINDLTLDELCDYGGWRVVCEIG